MNYFLRANKNLITYSLIILIIIPIFGINFFIGLIGNILFFISDSLFLFLVFVGFNFYQSKIRSCNNCGAISLGLSKPA